MDAAGAAGVAGAVDGEAAAADEPDYADELEDEPESVL